MPSHCDHSAPTLAPQAGVLTIALAGNPNSGKTTLFNALTGLRQKVANYPGVTVEKKTGKMKLGDGRTATLIDLPGSYSLISRSPDEQVAMEVLRGLLPGTPAPDAVIVVVDASNLQRNLYLVSQIVEMGLPMVVALNMMDIAQRRGIHVSATALEKQLGVPVVAVVGHKKQGLDELRAAVARACVPPLPDFPLPEPMKSELLAVGAGLAKRDAEQRIKQGAPPRSAWICREDPGRRIDRYEAMAERLLIGDRAADMTPALDDPHVAEILRGAMGRLQGAGIDPMQADVEAHYRWIEGVAGGCTADPEELAAMGSPADGVLSHERTRRITLTDRVDSVLIHKVWGLAIFALIMASLFVSIFFLAAPIQDGLEGAIKWLGGLLTRHMGDGPVKSLINDGIFAGVGAVVVFVPQIAMLFLFLGILEDSGYLARAAFLMDRLLAKVGLHGKSFIPLLSSFACAIPGIMATRTIDDRKDRLATIFVAPFMSCSARLPVYTLLIGTFFAGAGALGKAGIMLGLYIFGIVAAAITAFIFRRSFLKGRSAAFILELPTYKIPQWSAVLRQVLVNTKEFLVKAGTIIFCFSVVLWALTYYPRLSDTQTQNITASAESAGQDVEKSVGSEQLRHSIAGRIGHVLEPAIRPLGYDWKMGVGLVSAFAAREVFVSTMGIVYAAADEEDSMQELSKQMLADKHPDGRRVWTPLVAFSLLVWFVLAMQCISTLAIVKRETQSWRWPVFMLLYMNGLAYLACLVIYQIGSRV